MNAIRLTASELQELVELEESEDQVDFQVGVLANLENKHAGAYDAFWGKICDKHGRKNWDITDNYELVEAPMCDEKVTATVGPTEAAEPQFEFYTWYTKPKGWFKKYELVQLFRPKMHSEWGEHRWCYLNTGKELSPEDHDTVRCLLLAHKAAQEWRNR